MRKRTSFCGVRDLLGGGENSCYATRRPVSGKCLCDLAPFLSLSFNPVNRNICSTGALETFFSPPRHSLCVRTERALCPLDGKNTNHFVNRRKFIFLLTSLTNTRGRRNSHKNFSLVLSSDFFFF